MLVPSRADLAGASKGGHSGDRPSASGDGRERLILALDFPSSARALSFLTDMGERTGRPPLWVKVGLQLFLAEGTSLVHTLRDSGYSVFLDLKLHDIPNTVASAIRALAALGADLLTVHASGGPAMLNAASDAVASSPHPTRLLAVTVLTSMDRAQLEAVGVASPAPEQVMRLARVAAEAGIRGLVASPLEAAMLRAEPDFSAAGFHLVTPGIRPQHSQGTDDQQRVATPTAAVRAGASQLVIGRPITQAPDPAAAYLAILGEIEAALLP